MGHTIKGQTPRQYRPSSTRPPSGLSPVNEGSENDRRRWNRLRQVVKRRSQMQRNIRTKGHAIRGRFKVTQSPPRKKSPSRVSAWKNTAPGVYFLSAPFQRGRFTFENIYTYIPFPKKKSPRR